jgi:phage-related minor tail protein
MDPVTIVGLVGTSTQLAALCINVTTGIHKLYAKYGRAVQGLESIQKEYSIICAAIESIKVWAESSPAARELNRKQQCQSLENALKSLIPSVERIAKDVDYILSKKTRRLRAMWNEDELKAHLDEARWQSHAVHMLVSTIHL